MEHGAREPLPGQGVAESWQHTPARGATESTCPTRLPLGIQLLLQLGLHLRKLGGDHGVAVVVLEPERDPDRARRIAEWKKEAPGELRAYLSVLGQPGGNPFPLRESARIPCRPPASDCS